MQLILDIVIGLLAGWLAYQICVKGFKIGTEVASLVGLGIGIVVFMLDLASRMV